MTKKLLKNAGKNESTEPFVMLLQGAYVRD